MSQKQARVAQKRRMTEARAANQRQTGESGMLMITHVNASSSPARLMLSDGSQRVVAPWSLTRIDASVTIIRAELVQLSREGINPEAAA